MEKDVQAPVASDVLFYCSVAVSVSFYILYSTVLNLWWNGRNHESGPNHGFSSKQHQTVLLKYI